MQTPKLKAFKLNVIVQRYVRPPVNGSIEIPEAVRTDTSNTLWELVAWNWEQEEYLGIVMHNRMILETPSDVAVPIGNDLFVIPASSVISILPWEE